MNDGGMEPLTGRVGWNKLVGRNKRRAGPAKAWFLTA